MIMPSGEFATLTVAGAAGVGAAAEDFVVLFFDETPLDEPPPHAAKTPLRPSSPTAVSPFLTVPPDVC
jgi:hypothetical protein